MAMHGPGMPGPVESDLHRSAVKLLADVEQQDRHNTAREEYTTKVERELEDERRKAGRLRARVEELEALEELPHPPAVEIRRPHDEAIEIWVDGEEIASANHDEHGWSGMAAVEKLTVRLARAFGVEMLETHGAGDDPACRVCGCTEDEACDGGCSWVDAGDPADERGPLCSSCEDPE